MAIAIDLGATHIRIAQVKNNQIKNKLVVDTPKSKNKIKQTLSNLVKKYPKEPIGLGVAGFVKDNKTVNTPNMDFDKVNLKKLFHQKVFVDNDANCAGLAELYYGNGKGKKNFILLTLGSGIGSAIIIEGKIYRGNGFAGEIGHTLINEGHLEEISSGNSQTKIGKKYGFKNKTHLQLQELAEKGNKKAQKIFDEIGENLGNGILNSIYILDPQEVIIGGGFSRVNLYWKSMKETIKKNDIVKRKVPIIKAKLGDDAGLIGAALLTKGH